MIKIYVRKPGASFGRVYKSKTSIICDKVAILGYISFVATGFITEDEWTKSQQPIIEKFELTVTETVIDGRSKLARHIPYFNWNEVIKCNNQFESIRNMK